MNTVFIEATEATHFNWGKFMVARFTPEEWVRREQLEGSRGAPMLTGRGWSPAHLLVVDLQTGEGAIFAARPGGDAKYDLDERRIWVCPMFEPFLGWLYRQDLSELDKLPRTVNLGAVETALDGYRREGKCQKL